MNPGKRKVLVILAFNFFCAFLFLMVSCQKEVTGVLPALATTDSTHTTDSTGSAIDTSGIHAAFSLVASSGHCSNVTVSGSYQAKVATTGANSVAIQVNVTKKGIWTYATATVNGYKFSGSGTFDTTGQKIMNLYASGTPLAGGQDIFPLKIGNTCSFSVAVAP